MSKRALVIGGTSGLGLELAKLLRVNHKVFITGRQDPEVVGLQFSYLALDGDLVVEDLDDLMTKLPKIDVLVYAAGFFQVGTIDELKDNDLYGMCQVGLLAPAMLLRRLLNKQDDLPGFIAITSTSQWTPRRFEPMYTAVKAGLGMLANSISLDERVGKVLVIGPSGMDTKFWREDGRDSTDMLNPMWVALETRALWMENNETFKYKFVRALRDPARIEVVETR